MEVGRRRREVSGRGVGAAPGLGAPVLVADLSTVTLGENVSLATIVSGGVAPNQFAYSLPPGGVSLDARSVNCTPGRIGTFTVNVTVTDALGRSRNASTTFTVLAPPPTVRLGPGAIWTPLTTAMGTSGTIAGAAGVAAAMLLLQWRGRARSRRSGR